MLCIIPVYKYVCMKKQFESGYGKDISWGNLAFIEKTGKRDEHSVTPHCTLHGS